MSETTTIFRSASSLCRPRQLAALAVRATVLATGIIGRVVACQDARGLTANITRRRTRRFCDFVAQGNGPHRPIVVHVTADDRRTGS